VRWSRRSAQSLAAALSLVLGLGVVTLAEFPASASTKWKVAASGKSTGHYSLANANAEILNPVKIEVTVTQAALVQWSVDCTKGTTFIKYPSGKEMVTKAGSVPVKIAKSANSCAVAANAQNYGTGTDELSIEFSGGSVGG
jgi:hypothetical protein